MKRFLDWILMTVVSPELLWVCAVFACYYFKCNWLSLFGEQLKSNTEIWKALYGLPFVLLGFTFKYTSKLLAPLEKVENKALYEWPGYTRIKDRAIFSILLCLLCCIGVIILWVVSKNIDDSLVSTLYMVSLGSSGIATLSLFFAEQKLKEILTVHTK